MQCPSLQLALNHPMVLLPKKGKWLHLQLSPMLSVTSMSFVFSRCFPDCTIRNLCWQDWLKTHEGGTEDDFKAYWLSLSVELVFKGPVQSGFLTSKWGNRNRNRSRTDPDIGWTEPDRLGPVFCSPWTEKRPVQTGFLM